MHLRRPVAYDGLSIYVICCKRAIKLLILLRKETCHTRHLRRPLAYDGLSLYVICCKRAIKLLILLRKETCHIRHLRRPVAYDVVSIYVVFCKSIQQLMALLREEICNLRYCNLRYPIYLYHCVACVKRFVQGHTFCLGKQDTKGHTIFFGKQDTRRFCCKRDSKEIFVKRHTYQFEERRYTPILFCNRDIVRKILLMSTKKCIFKRYLHIAMCKNSFQERLTRCLHKRRTNCVQTNCVWE